MSDGHQARNPGLRHLVLAGSGPGHLWLLAQLARSRPADLNISLVASASSAMPSRLLADWASGVHALADCTAQPHALAHACHARVLASPCSRLHAGERRLELADGTELHFDWLSLDTEDHMGRARIDALMPGARTHALFAHPVAQFAQLWPQVMTMAAQRPIHVVLVGGGLWGLELAIALALALRAGSPASSASRLSWVTPEGLAQLLPVPAARLPLERRLRELDITLLHAACVGFEASAVLLDNGARLVCDAPIVAGPSALPDWLAAGDLATDPHGRIEVDARARSTSHSHVLAVNDVAGHASRAADANAPTDAAWGSPCPDRSGPMLLASLRDDWRSATGARPARRWPRPAPLRMLACGPQLAIANWYGMTLRGQLLAALRHHWDRRFLHSLHEHQPTGNQA